MIAETSEKLGQIPRRFDLWTKYMYLHSFASSTLRKYRPELLTIYDNWERLITEGQVVLGVIVQANVRLFEKGKKNHPANIIYSTDTDAESKLEKLFSIADQINYLKNQDFLLNQDEIDFSELVADEMKSAFNVRLPKVLSQNMSVYFTTTVINRNHLPSKRLSQNFFPLLIHPEIDASMIVPSRYWSEDLLKVWEDSSSLQ